MGQIYLVRHGQASFGAADYDELSPTGREQSRLLGAWFGRCGQRFGQVVTGSLRRHRQTAEACLAAAEVAANADRWLGDAGFDEYDHVELLARLRSEYADSQAAARLLSRDENPRLAFQQTFAQAMKRWMSGEHDGEYRESWQAFGDRCNAALDRLVRSAGASQNLIVFTSGGPIAAICQRLLGIPDHKAAELNWSLVNSGVTRLLYRPDRVSLNYLNSFAHLELAGQPQTITYR